MEEEYSKHSVTALWIIMILSVIVILGLSIYAGLGYNYSFPDLTNILPH